MSFFKKLKTGLTKTRAQFTKGLDAIIPGRTVDDELLEELEDLLITSDFGLDTSVSIIAETRERFRSVKGNEAEAFREVLKEVVRDRLLAVNVPEAEIDKPPRVILVVGVNGVGKTTTIGKMAAHYTGQGKKVLLAAGDTFRAAAVEQLQEWGRRSNCPVVSQGANADSASVIYDAHGASIARGMDILLADTAGRLHTKSHLMDELKKIKRVLGQQDLNSPHEVLMVLDATTGQNAISQVKHFHKDMELTGLVVTKLDGTAKGGVLVSLSEQFALPIKFIGVGEGIDDLKPFDPVQFADALF
ncbi:MAG: signal recognition particle-docking protein FtsY [Magnetococcales bacterium]|nr:signal recognition particle-docking protein FtsY [Magnetococcales bacterium]